MRKIVHLAIVGLLSLVVVACASGVPCSAHKADRRGCNNVDVGMNQCETVKASCAPGYYRESVNSRAEIICYCDNDSLEEDLGL